MRDNRGELFGRWVLLTGATRGFGRCLAERLCRKGANLIAVGRSEEKLEELRVGLSEPGRVWTVTVDLSRVEAAETLLSELDALGVKQLDVLINNAAIQGPIGPIWMNNWDQWIETIQVDLLTPVNICRLLLTKLEQSTSRAKIINISGGGSSGPRTLFSAYAIAKTGIVRFTEILAEELLEKNIDVNAVAPGAMRTSMTEAIVCAGKKMAGLKEFSIATRLIGESDTSVMDKAIELCMFLCSSESDGVTGKLIAAQWDPWNDFPRLREELKNSDIYTLRRITPSERGKVWGG